MYSPELIREEKRNLRVSGVWTAVIMTILLLLTLIFTAYRNRVPPPVKKYEVMGAIDFGDMRNGSKNVNTRERAVANPVDKPTPTTEPQPAPTPVEAAPTPPKEITTTRPTPVSKPDPPKVKDPTPVPDPPKTTTPKQTQNTTPSKPTPTPTESKPKTDEKPVLTLDDESGSNDGDNPSGTGNQGTPQSPVLNDNALYTFGAGLKGPSARGYISITDPVYNCQEEGDLKIEFDILPDGSVGRIKRPISTNTCLVQAAMAAIRSWKFTAAPGAPVLSTNVIIKFRLR